jgi:hypothetical protein
MNIAQKLAVNEEQASNDGANDIDFSHPYVARVTIVGTADLLFHRWSNEAVAEKAKSAKNSKAKKTDNVQSYVYRAPDGSLGVPGENLRQSIIGAAKFRQDPRSPRKSAMDLYKAAVISLTTVAPFEPKTSKWDYEDARRAVVQRAAITRIRPAMRAGWRLSFEFLINLPEYVSENDLREVIEQSGRLIGLCDFRPTYGRFGVVQFSVAQAT